MLAPLGVCFCCRPAINNNLCYSLGFNLQGFFTKYEWIKCEGSLNSKRNKYKNNNARVLDCEAAHQGAKSELSGP